MVTLRHMLDLYFLPARELQRNYKKVFAKAKASKKPVIIMSNNKPQAAVISMDYLEELESAKETAEILAIPGAKERILQAGQEIERGEFVALEDLP